MLTSNITASLFKIGAVVVYPSFFLLLFFSLALPLISDVPSLAFSCFVWPVLTPHLICGSTPYRHWSPVLVSPSSHSQQLDRTVCAIWWEACKRGTLCLFPQHPLWWKSSFGLFLRKTQQWRLQDAVMLGTWDSLFSLPVPLILNLRTTFLIQSADRTICLILFHCQKQH